MRVVDPYRHHLLMHHTDAVRAAMLSNAATYIRFAIAELLADVEDNDEPDSDFTRGMRMGLRLAFIAAGGDVDGSEEQWAAIVQAGRE
jgi:hypothetical protein